MVSACRSGHRRVGRAVRGVAGGTGSRRNARPNAGRNARRIPRRRCAIDLPGLRTRGAGARRASRGSGLGGARCRRSRRSRRHRSRARACGLVAAALPRHRRGRRRRRRPERQHPEQRHSEARILVRRQRQFVAADVRDLVEQLDFLRVEQPRQPAHLASLRPFVLHRSRHRLRKRDLVQQRPKILQGPRERQAAIRHRIRNADQRGAILGGQRIEQLHEVALVDRPEHPPHGILRHLPSAIRNGLIGQRQRIAHGTVRRLREQPQRIAIMRNAFLCKDMVEVRDDMSRRHLLEVELQAARQHRDRNLLRIGGGKNELDVPRRLLQRLQHRVEGVVGEHVHFVDHVDLEPAHRRCIHRLVQQLRHFIDAAVGGRVHLDVVDEPPAVDLLARLALPAWLGRDAPAAVNTRAVERLGQNPRERGLADAARAGEQIGVV
ncbi:hypothetical protein LMG26296_05634 [Cupriavidus plantarum]|nr:hypothetical protein LMG26296_05634 [Cupriavidus plantarum]